MKEQKRQNNVTEPYKNEWINCGEVMQLIQSNENEWSKYIVRKINNIMFIKEVASLKYKMWYWNLQDNILFKRINTYMVKLWIMQKVKEIKQDTS